MCVLHPPLVAPNGTTTIMIIAIKVSLNIPRLPFVDETDSPALNSPHWLRASSNLSDWLTRAAALFIEV